MNNQLTIILTLKDRSPFTYRWMRYMEESRSPYPILIADGGRDLALERHLRDTWNYPSLRYTYVRYPYDDSFETYYSKLSDIVARVTTPYLLFADNDDFYLLDNVAQCIEFLDGHDDFVSCGGALISLTLLSPEGRTVATPSAAEYRAVQDRREKSVTGEAAVDRLCAFLDRMEQDYLWYSWYNVHRTSAVQFGSSFVTQFRFCDPVSFEFHMHICMLSLGSYRWMDMPLLVLQVATSQSTAALNASSNVLERFLAQDAFADVRRSLDACGISDHADILRIWKAFARWMADQVFLLYAPRLGEPPPTVVARGRLERIYRWCRRQLRPIRRLLSAQRAPVVVPALRLPFLEKYILQSGPNPSHGAGAGTLVAGNATVAQAGAGGHRAYQ